MDIPELTFLLNEVEKKFGRRVSTSTDFETLSITIEMTIGDHISSSTLKRLWGYVSLSPTPRIATLDILARYLGQRGFKEYCQKLKDTDVYASTFFSARVIDANSLNKGAHVSIGWAPNRMIELEYLGNYRFKVAISANSQLRTGDEFETAEFILGYPLLLQKIYRNGETTPPFIAGRQGGLCHIEVLK